MCKLFIYIIILLRKTFVAQIINIQDIIRVPSIDEMKDMYVISLYCYLETP